MCRSQVLFGKTEHLKALSGSLSAGDNNFCTQRNTHVFWSTQTLKRTLSSTNDNRWVFFRTFYQGIAFANAQHTVHQAHHIRTEVNYYTNHTISRWLRSGIMAEKGTPCTKIGDILSQIHSVHTGMYGYQWRQISGPWVRETSSLCCWKANAFRAFGRGGAKGTESTHNVTATRELAVSMLCWTKNASAGFLILRRSPRTKQSQQKW